LRRLEGTQLPKVVVVLPQRLGLSMLRCLEAQWNLKVRFIRSQPIAVVLERNFRVLKRWRYPILTRSEIYLDRSCCVLRPASLPRRLCIYLVEWKLFEHIVLMATLVNCVAIALESPSEVKSKLKESFINVREHSGLTHARLIVCEPLLLLNCGALACAFCIR
jgi:hypothetical protein